MSSLKLVKHDQYQSHTHDTSKIILVSSYSMTIKDLANLISKKNIMDTGISKIIKRPTEKGHVGEYIASQIFDIELSDSATNKGSHGYFRTGNLSNKKDLHMQHQNRPNSRDFTAKGVTILFNVIPKIILSLKQIEGKL